MASFESRKILVTGGSGFIGRNLVRFLSEQGCDVTVLLRQSSGSSVLSDCLPANKIHRHDGTIDSLRRIFDQTRPELVIHLASFFTAEHAPDQIANLIDSNLKFSTILLEAMTLSGCRLFINTGSAWQNHLNQPYNPVNLYAATKQAFEDILRYYCETRELKAITLRLYDTYGPGDPRPKLIKLLCSSARSGEELLMSPGEQLIDLVHIRDVIKAYHLAGIRLFEAHSDQKHEIYALSSGQPLKLRKLVELFEEVNQLQLNIKWGGRPYRSREVMIPWNNGVCLPGWTTTVPLREGLHLL